MSDLSRRDFVKKTAIKAAAVSACACGLGSCASYTKVGRTPAANPEALAFRDTVLTIDLSKEPNLSRIGGSAKILHAGIPDGLIVAHVDEDRFEVVSLLCTHRGVEVDYRHRQSDFQCASTGGSIFTMNGRNVSGPAPRPLRDYEADVRNGLLTIRI